MASRSTSGVNIKPLGPLAAAIGSLFQPGRTTIRGVDSSDWFGPLQPVKPIAPAGTQPRRTQYIPGQNLLYTPRAEEPLTAKELRELASYPLARICIENVKDLICQMKITARLKRLDGETNADHKKRSDKDTNLPQIQQLIDQPNPEQTRSEFVRQVLEDMLVLDAPSVLLRRTKSKLVEMRAIDGATITRYIDEQGYTPQPPDPAYAQVWYGIPMVDLNTDQLVYAPRNILPNRIYGYGPTEQNAPEIKVGIERLNFVLAYYTQGTIPDALQIVPMTADPDKIKESQDWIQSTLAGQLAKRRGMRLIQGFTEDGKDQIIFPKEKLLADAFDDLHIRKICFGYGTSPQRLLRMMNRAASDSNQEAAQEEGTMPWVSWLIDSIYNRIFQQKCGYSNYECTIDTDVETDPLKQAETDKSDVSTGIVLINEARKKRGLDPLPQPEANMPLVITATGPVPLSVDDQVDAAQKMSEVTNAGDPAAGDAGNGKNPQGGKKPGAAGSGGTGSGSKKPGAGSSSGGSSKKPKKTKAELAAILKRDY